MMDESGDYWKRYDLSKNADFDGSWNIRNKYFEYAKKSNKSFSWWNYQKLFISLKFYLILGLFFHCLFFSKPFHTLFLLVEKIEFFLYWEKRHFDENMNMSIKTEMKSFEEQFSAKEKILKNEKKDLDLSWV